MHGFVATLAGFMSLLCFGGALACGCVAALSRRPDAPKREPLESLFRLHRLDSAGIVFRINSRGSRIGGHRVRDLRCDVDGMTGAHHGVDSWRRVARIGFLSRSGITTEHSIQPTAE